jgi:hypothetical protein
MANPAISALVDQKTSERTRKLETDLAKVLKQLDSLQPSPKKYPRGQGGASKKNKTAQDSKMKKTNSPKRPPDPKADDAANATNKGRGGKPNKASKSSSTKRSGNTRTNSGKPSD